MGKIIELTHDDVQNELAYALICETMEGAYWNSGRRRRMFSKAFTRSEQQRISNIKTKTDIDMTIVQSDKTNLEMIRTLDKFHLAMLLNHIYADSKNWPSSTTGWCEWLNSNWNFMT